MADRFPSLDDFDAGQTEVQDQPSAIDTDEPSDFLARERAALGDDAQQFTSSGDNMATVADEEEDDDDLLGGGSGSQPIADMDMNGSSNGMDMMGDFETSFPSVDTQNENVAPGGGTITGSTLPYRAPDTYQDSASEPDSVREWRERRDAQIQHRDDVSAQKKSETVKAAQEAIDEFYENYNNRKDKQISQTRKEAEEFLKGREDTTSGGTSWERIAKLVDLSGKGAGGGASGTSKARMRELLLSLRKDEKAPGATGY
ncbi:Clathrin light chain [Vermiconidia calcicola]|uniref:Clathrin light chain n=1 Tax=Vermiconidia calcicola TaxID=1690605 RepID=A0ACC3N8M6_9PEZI|nr:Clathrin light chain [Vermiconidia calcicola]